MKMNNTHRLGKPYLLVFLAIALLMILPSVSAFEFDNVKSYNAVAKEVTIKNSFLGIPTTTVAKVKLVSDLDVRIGAGYQKVAEFSIDSYEVYANAIQTLELYNVKTGNPLDRIIDYKYLTYQDVKVPNYVEECTPAKLTEDEVKNETKPYDICEQILKGTKLVPQEVWAEFTTKDMKAEKLTIGLFTDVQVGDSVEWIPNFYGIKVSEWATWTQDLNVGLISYYAFEGNLLDSVHAGRNWVNVGIFNASGIIGSGINTTGSKTATREYGNIPVGTQAITTCVWNKMDTTNPSQCLFGWGTFGDGGLGWNICTDAGKYGITGFYHDVYSASTSPKDAWHFVCGVQVSGNDRRLYVDGVSVANGTDSYNTGTTYTPTLGTNPQNPGDNKGTMDELGIWNRALTQAEITTLYNGGTGMTYIGPAATTWTIGLNTGLVSYYKFDEPSGTVAIDSLNTLNGTITGATVNQAGLLGKAYSYDGGSDKVNINAHPLKDYQSGSFTAWMNTSTFASEGVILAEGKAGGGTPYQMLITNAGGGISFGYSGGGVVVGPGNLTTNVWQFLAVVNNGTNTLIYINGELKAVGDVSFFGDFAGDTLAYGVLDRGSPYAWFTGLIDEAGIWNRTLTQADVTQLYNNGLGITYTNQFNTAPSITMNTASATYTDALTKQINLTAWDGEGIANVSVYVNGVLNQTNTSGLNNTVYLFNIPLGDGNNSIVGGVVDNYSTPLSTNSSTIYIFIDSIHPIVTGNLSNSTLYVLGGNMTVNYNVTHNPNLTGVTAWYNYNGVNVTLDTAQSRRNITTVAGQYTITLFANDTLGNEATPVVLTFTLDSVAPVLSSVALNASIVYRVGETVRLSATATDAANLDKCWYQYNSINTTFACTSGVATQTNIVTVAGQTSFIVYANDTAGNKATPVATSFTYDTTPPTLTNVALNTSIVYTIGDNILLNFTATDTNLDKCWYSYNGINTTVACVSGVVAQATRATIAGQTNIVVYANDTMDNKAIPVSISFTYDTTPPVITLIGPTNGTAYNSSWNNISINFTATDTNLNVCKWNINGGTWTTISCNTNISYLVHDGNNVINYYANDTIGNDAYNSLLVVGGPFQTIISNGTVSIPQINGTSSWPESANITFNSSSPSTGFFSWLVGGIERLAGYGQNVFNWVFNNPVSAPNSEVLLNTYSSVNGSTIAGLFSYYKFDETGGTNAADLMGLYNGTNTGATVNQPGVIGTAYSYNGAGNKVNINSHPILGWANGSVSVWIKPNGFNDEGVIIAEGLAGGGVPYLMLVTTAGGGLSFGYNGGGVVVGAGNLTAGVWQFITLVNNGTNNNIYINGVLKASGDPSFFGDFAGDTFAVGILDRASPYGPFNGSIDELGIWTSSLSQAEISLLYNSGAGSRGFVVVDSNPYNPLSTTASPYSGKGGMRVIPLVNITISSFNVQTAGTATKGYILDASKNVLASVTLTGNDAIFPSGYALVAGTTYYFAADNNGNNHTMKNDGGAVFPAVSANFNWTGGLDPFDTGDVSNNAHGIANVTSGVSTYGAPLSTYNFTIETNSVSPLVSLTYPLSGTNYEGTSIQKNISLNWTASDINLRACWYNVNGTNITIASNCTQTSTFVVLNQGIYNITLYVNDSAGNVNHSTATNVGINQQLPSVSLASPTNGQEMFFTNVSTVANGTVTHGQTMTNISYYDNSTGTWAVRNTTSSAATNMSYVNSFTPGAHILWNMKFCQGDGLCDWASANQTFFIHSGIPSITFNYPTPIINYGTPNGTLQLNITATDATALDTLLFNYNGSDVIIPGAVSGVPSFANITLTTKKNVSITVNDTAGNSNTSIFNWDYRVFENSRNYSTSVYETALETYSVNVTASASLTAVHLVRDGTSYSATNMGGGIYTASVNTPASVGNKTIAWRFTYSGVDFMSDTSYQTVNSFAFGPCNGTLTTRLLNLSFIDEQTLLPMNATMDSAVVVYSLTPLTSSGTVTKTFSFINNTNNMFYDFCIAPSLTPVYSSGTFQYSQAVTGTYPQRRITFTETYTNTTITNHSLYLLNFNNGLTSNYQVITVGNQIIAGARISITRVIGTTITAIADGTTDASGQISFFLNPNYEHTFTISATGFATQTQVIRPSQPQYTITMGTQSNPFLFNGTSQEGITYSKWPMSGPIQNRGVYNFTFEILHTLGNRIYNCTMNIKYGNGTVLGTATGCNSLAPLPFTGGKIGVAINVTGLPTDKLYGQYYATIIDTNGSISTILLEGDAQWRMVPVTGTNNYFSTIRGAIKDLIDAPEWGTACGADAVMNTTDLYCYPNDGSAPYWHQTVDFSRIVAFFIFLAIALAILNFFTGYDTAYPGSFLYLITFIVVIMSAVNGVNGPGYFYLEGATFSSGGMFSGFAHFFDNWILAAHFVLLSFIYFFTTNKRYQSG